MAERPPPNMGRRRVVYRPDHSMKGIGGLLISKQIHDALDGPAGLVADLAAGFTPRGKDEGRSKDKGPHMADSFAVDKTPRIVKVGAKRNRRVSIRVINPVDHAGAVEFGVRGRPGSRPLGKAGAIVGRFTYADTDGA